ncbi:MAG TPA: hypothetical protein VG248_13285, partial [Caulobacteraceae bacterium]|nr:hypothetical protein [Caulobacteraceae bacterium]
QVSYVNVVALDEMLSVGGEKGDKLTLGDTLEDHRAEDPVLAFEGEETGLIGSRLDEAALARLDAAAQSLCRPIDDKRGTAEYRTKIAGVLARRAAAIAYERAQQV